MNPFDVKEALLARHAQHVVLVHFPIALFMAGVVFAWLARWTKRCGLQEAAYFNLLAAAVSTPPVLGTGMLAWRLQLEGQRLHGMLLLHLILACVSGAMIWLVWGLHLRARRNLKGFSPSFVLALELVTMGLVALTAHVGGYLSGVNGLG